MLSPTVRNRGLITIVQVRGGLLQMVGNGVRRTRISRQAPAILITSIESRIGPTMQPSFLETRHGSILCRGNGCSSCPIRCHTMLKVPAVSTKYGIPAVGQNTCAGLLLGRAFFKTFPDGPKGQTAIEACMVGMHLADDLGVWDNYGQLQRDLQGLYYKGTLKGKLDESEFKSYSWEKYEKGDPSFLFELLPRIANKEGELATALGLGTGYMLERWGIPEQEWSEDHNLLYWKMGHPKHHSNEDAGQCGMIINTQYNRDVQCHSHSNFTRNGLPLDVQKRLAAELWGSPDAVDAVAAFTRMNSTRPKWRNGPFCEKNYMTLCLSAIGWGRGLLHR